MGILFGTSVVVVSYNTEFYKIRIPAVQINSVTAGFVLGLRCKKDIFIKIIVTNMKLDENNHKTYT